MQHGWLCQPDFELRKNKSLDAFVQHAVEPEEPSFFRADSIFINAEDSSSQRFPSVVELSSEFGWVGELAAGSSG